jgi:allophanate hydrolase
MSTTSGSAVTSSAVERVGAALEALATTTRPEAWIALRDDDDLLAEAQTIDARRAAGESLPLAGWTVAVKDNIDVLGLPTTAGCPAFAYDPQEDAIAVARLRAAGAIVLGKTSLDQFATGLVGTRSPYGEVRDVRNPALVSGGSSSGSAVAVALGIADIALATDTAGSGRVPAAFQGIVGLKATVGVIPTDGVVPACRSFDCVSLMAPALEPAQRALEVLGGRDRLAGGPLAAGSPARLATFPAEALSELCDEYREAFEQVKSRALDAGALIVEIDPTPFLAAGALLYDGAFVAERYAAVGRFIEDHLEETDPSVAAIVLGAREVTATAYIADCERLERLRRVAAAELRGSDALLLPTAPWQPTIAEVERDPLEVNRRMGSYVTFCNLIGLCAVALPAGEAGGGHFGVTLYAPAYHDLALAELCDRLAAVLDPGAAPASAAARGEPAGAIELLVVGAHMSCMPLNSELTDRGGRLVCAVETAPNYRLYRLDTSPPKPGLVRTARDEAGSAAVAGELWALPAAGLASLLASLPTPMALGRVALSDGTEVVGFLCEPAALAGAQEITEYGGWRAYVSSDTA